MSLNTLNPNHQYILKRRTICDDVASPNAWKAFYLFSQFFEIFNVEYVKDFSIPILKTKNSLRYGYFGQFYT